MKKIIAIGAVAVFLASSVSFATQTSTNKATQHTSGKYMQLSYYSKTSCGKKGCNAMRPVKHYKHYKARHYYHHRYYHKSTCGCRG